MHRAIAILFLLAACLQATADNGDGIKQRMRDRLPAITALKIAKTVGEDNKGYLQVLGNIAAADRAVVEAENADRKVVYAAIAAKTGATAEVVGQKRAASIAESSASGVMLQAPDGVWYEKK